ncbi:MAG: bacillithiol biosynthesis cysteine-adding enzyme BshC [Chitinophagales bacterium]
MQKSEIPYASTGFFSKIILDYLSGEESLMPFYDLRPELSSFKEAIQKKQKEFFDRSNLAATILKQYKDAGVNGAEAQIDLLKNANTFCLVTAHQLNIFTGPLYFIYKIISTINTCKTLKEFNPEYNFVPVFWLGSEDHDFDEINHFSIFGKTISWQTEGKGATGRLNPSSIEAVLNDLKAVLGESENAKHIFHIFEDAYTTSLTLAQATRKYLHTLFGEKGLVIIDGDDNYLKSVCIPLTEDEITNQSSYSIVTKTCEKLALQYSIQANPREINLFYLKDNLRERIAFDSSSNKYQVLNTQITFSKEEILQEVKTNPRHFSPNVILRPLFQQKVLPALAYVGGGGELAYWLQLKELFNHHNITFPVLLLRNSALIIDNITSAKMQKLKLQPAHIFAEEETLLKIFLKANTSTLLSLEKQREKIENILEEIKKQAVTIDSSLENAVNAEKQNLLNSFQKLEAKLLKAEKLRAETSISQIRNIKHKLFPSGDLQERKENFLQFYTLQGNVFFEQLYAAFEPFQQTFVIIQDIKKT